jgi:hypothetical protein
LGSAAKGAVFNDGADDAAVDKPSQRVELLAAGVDEQELVLDPTFSASRRTFAPRAAITSVPWGSELWGFVLSFQATFFIRASSM